MKRSKDAVGESTVLLGGLATPRLSALSQDMISQYHRLSQIYMSDTAGTTEPLDVGGGTATVSSSAMAMTSVVMGLGILTLPRILHSQGLILGCAYIIACGAMIGYMNVLLCKAIGLAEKKNSEVVTVTIKKYEEVARICFGNMGGRIVAGLTIGKLFCSIVGLLILMGDYFDMLLPFNFFTKRLMIIVSGCLLGIPLSLVKDMSFMTRFSFAGTVLTIMLPLFLICWSIHKLATGENDFSTLTWHPFQTESWLKDSLKSLTDFGLVIFSYNSIVVMPSIRAAMKNRLEMPKSIYITKSIAIATYLVVALLCVLAASSVFVNDPKAKLSAFFLEKPPADAPEGFKPAPTYPGLIFAFVIICSVMTSFPVFLNVFIVSLESYVSRLVPSVSQYMSPMNIGYRVSCVIVATALAVLIPIFDDFTKVVASLFLVTLNFILPLLFLRKLTGSFGSSPAQQYFNIFLLGLSVIILVVGTYKNVLDLIDRLQEGKDGFFTKSYPRP